MEPLILAFSLVGVIKAALAIIAVFVVCVVIHEFGHFYVAKRSGVSVPIFAVGMGPRLFSWKKNGTEYSLRAFPIGGFVQLSGEMPQDSLFRVGERIAYELDSDNRIIRLGDPRDLRDAYIATLKDLDLSKKLSMTLLTEEGIQTFAVKPHARLMMNARSSVPIVERHEQVLGKPLYQRAAIILAGPIMNFLLAGILFSVSLMHTGVVQPTPTIGDVVANSPAASAGLRSGDVIEKISGTKITSWTDVVTAIQADRSRPPKPLQVTVLRNNAEQTVSVTPRLTKQNLPQLGIDAGVTHNPVLAVKQGFEAVYYNSVNAVQLYGQVIQHHQFQDLSGPVGIADVISQQANRGIWQLLLVTGALSLNLGLFNLLPIPALDGGRLLFMIVEAVRGKAVDPRKEGLVHLIGFGLLMLFTLVITYRDVTRLF